MDGDRAFNLHWGGEVVVKHDPGTVTNEVICGLDNVHNSSFSNMTSDEMIADTDQMAAENLMFLSQDVVGYTETAELADDPNVECVTEEVITDDWVISGGQERVEVPMDHLSHPMLDVKEENDIDVPLPTDQDEYTAMRPWPCDFCSRRFRKKAALMNHMVAHQNDRPHACNLCGVRYVRKCDLMNHLKVHAYVPDDADEQDIEDLLVNNQIVKPKKKRGRRKKNPEPEERDPWQNMRSARTQQWSRRARSPARSPPRSPPPASPPAPAPAPASPPPPPADPSRPFVCRQCGVGFAREKALKSHSRVHGGDSPVDCGECGELCWSRDALAQHAAQRHPNRPPQPTVDAYNESDSGDDMDYRLSPESAPSVDHDRDRERDRERPVFDTMKGPELFCSDCGVAFQRADLLRRHVAAAHSYGRGAASCEECGEGFRDALQLLAHAEGHAHRAAPRTKRFSRSRNSTSISSNSRQFPCKECGKVFGSRSSQQIHIRIHTGERPYACRFCWKAFADGGTLRKHERIHTGEKPYACAVCPRAFNQRVVLREHVRSHHSAPDRRANGGPAYCCVVCGRALSSSPDLVQHLIQHCDANTALKRQPQTGPRKYKRRRKMKSDVSPVRREWRSPSPSPPRGSPSPSRAAPRSPTPPPAPARRRRGRAPRPRPRMIHTEGPRTRNKQLRTRRPPRHPADDLRAIGPHSPSPSPRRELELSPNRDLELSPNRDLELSPRRDLEPSPKRNFKREHESPKRNLKRELESPKREISPQPLDEAPASPYKCEMCSLEFEGRDALLIHVPVHI